jgi:hypothetical protein
MLCRPQELYSVQPVGQANTEPGAVAGSPRGQPAWGGGSDRIEHSAGLHLATLLAPLGILG